MKHWLIKSEPGTWSWQDQCAAPRQTTPWDGVRNHQAAANLKAMRKGDLAFFYHSVSEKQIVGIVKIVREAYPDPGDKRGRFVQVDVQAVEAVDPPVTLRQIKEDPKLAELPLIRQSRLSVMPLDKASWSRILKLSS